MLTKFLKLVKQRQANIVLAVAVVLISLLSFQAGKIYTLRLFSGTEPVLTLAPMSDLFSPTPASAGGLAKSSPNLKESSVIASKNGSTKLFHYPWCPGATKISEKNKISFVNEAAAIAAGYTLASNCQK